MAASEMTAGEAQAQACDAANRARFVAAPIESTPHQVEAAVAQGNIAWRARSPWVLRDGGDWALPTQRRIKLGRLE
jgi:hypothetical protein